MLLLPLCDLATLGAEAALLPGIALCQRRVDGCGHTPTVAGRLAGGYCALIFLRAVRAQGRCGPCVE
tara:strand:+ start:1119 stop:1319 length:201 start_codon:yes stop_codon:yes gene_type:complete